MNGGVYAALKKGVPGAHLLKLLPIDKFDIGPTLFDRMERFGGGPTL